MDKATVFTKTAKGITQVNQKSASLSKDLMKVLKLIDGKSNFGQLLEKAELDKNVLERALNTLTKDGFARVFETRKEEVDPFGGDAAAAAEDDFDFTAPKKLPGATQRVIPAAANDISALAAAQKKADEDRKAKEAAHEAARLQARTQAEARARADAEAKARQAAEATAMEQARKAKEASERARAELEVKMREEEARKQALAAAQAKQAAEAKVREEAEARRFAELRAKAEKEANERARAELEAKLREEEAKKKVAAEQAAREAAEQKAKEEEESRKLAELRVRAEREAQALAEARARAEAEAAAMAKARAEADAAAKKQAQEATQAAAEMKAKLKDEIESRIRQEMEDLLRNEVEEKTRAQMQKQIMEEAKLAAKAELEERLREERELIAKAEAEAATKAERDATARAEEESKKRAEAEARAKAETEARIRAEEETRRLRAQAEEQARKSEEQLRKAQAEAAAAAGAAAAAAAKAKQEAEARALEAVNAAEAKAKQEAEARARVQAEADARVRKETEERARMQAEAEKQLQAERQAKYEAEARAKIDAEEREKRERALAATLDAERKAKEEAEQRARAEARARETVEADTRAKVQAELETDLAKKAEIEGKAQAKAYMEAKVKAEQDEDERMRAEQARRAQEIAAVLRTKVEPDAAAPAEGGAPARRRTYRRKGNLVRNVAFGLVGALVLAVIAVHVIPMRGLANKVEKSLSAWLNDDVTIAATTFRLVPSPHLKVQNLAVGKALDAKAITGRIYVDVGSLLGDKVSISSVELDNVSISSEAVARLLPVWSQPNRKAETGIGSIRLTGVKLDVKPVLEPFNAVLLFNRDGTFKQANLNSGTTWSLAMKPAAEKGMELDFNARNWTLPVGAPIPVNDVRLKGTLAGSEIVVPEFEASAMEGKVNGTLKVSWAKGVRVESDLAVAKMSAGELIKSFTKDIAVTGRFDGNFAFATEGPNVESIFNSPRVQGKFRLGEGSISNVDLVAVMQSDSAGTRAGVTKFNEVTGEFASVNRGASYRQVNLQGGVLRGNGQVDVGNNSALSGRVNLEIRSQVAQDRGGFTVSGTVSRPIVRRGG